MRRLWAVAAAALACSCSSASAPQAGRDNSGSGSVGGAADAGPGGASDAGPSEAGPPDSGPPPPGGGGDWGQYRHDQRGGSENPAIFTAADAVAMAPLWAAELTRDAAGKLTGYVYTQAMITQDLVVFTTAFSGKVVAVDGNIGSVRWARDLNMPISTACNGAKKPGFWAAAAVVGDVVYAASPDGHAYALRKSDGSTIWTAAVADPSAAGHGEFIQSSPSISTALGKMYLGVASSEHCDLIGGRLVSAGQRGAGVWSSISVAEDENRLYATSGNRVGPIADEPYSQSILAVDPQTLDILDHWQNPTPLENSDFGSSPALGEAGGLKLVAATNKDGWLYVLRRDALSAGPLWKHQMAIIDPADSTAGGDPVRGFGSISTPSFAHGLLYAAGGQTPQGEAGSVVAFEPATGKVTWKHATPGYVLGPMALAGEVLVVGSTALDNSSSTLEVLDGYTGTVLRSFQGAAATFGGPSIGRGMIVWTDQAGHASVFAVKKYRP